MYVSHKAHDEFHPVYERSLLSALSDIVSQIPPEDLAIQIDVCQEVLLFEGYFEHRPEDYKERVFATLARLSDAVPEDAQLGFHLCYGSPFDAPLVRPKDMSILVELANGIATNVARRVDFIHVPVPQGRTEAEFYEPLRELDVSAGTEIYLGLVLQGDRDGDQQRIKIAKNYLDEFGVATECGWGRTSPENVPGLLESHRLAAEAL
jgi:methionine synthase II (cobalamin-independent)